MKQKSALAGRWLEKLPLVQAPVRPLMQLQAQPPVQRRAASAVSVKPLAAQLAASKPGPSGRLALLTLQPRAVRRAQGETHAVATKP